MTNMYLTYSSNSYLSSFKLVFIVTQIYRASTNQCHPPHPNQFNATNIESGKFYKFKSF